MAFCLAQLSVFPEIYIILYDISLKGQSFLNFLYLCIQKFFISLKYHTNYTFTGPWLSAGDSKMCQSALSTMSYLVNVLKFQLFLKANSNITRLTLFIDYL